MSVVVVVLLAACLLMLIVNLLAVCGTTGDISKSTDRVQAGVTRAVENQTDLHHRLNAIEQKLNAIERASRPKEVRDMMCPGCENRRPASEFEDDYLCHGCREA